MTMTFKVTAVCAALAVFASPAFAVSAWTGPGVVKTVTTACKSGGPKINSRLTLTYAPGNVNGDSHLAILARPKAFHLHKSGGDFAAGNIITEILVVKGNLDVVGILDNPPASKLASWTSSPALPTVSDPYITLNMKLTNFGGITGCTVSLGATLSRLDGT